MERLNERQRDRNQNKDKKRQKETKTKRNEKGGRDSSIPKGNGLI